MTFPIIEILCPVCKKPMIMTNNVELISSANPQYNCFEYTYLCGIDSQTIKVRIYVKGAESETVQLQTTGFTTTAGTHQIYCNIEDTFLDLAGKPYKPVIKDGLYMCPKCEGHIVPLNPTQHDPDYYYYRCNKCKMDFRIINKADKDFKF
ncbi:hypothetical protein LCGC14_0885740 [marine sediment metagenome]|uniref:Uncharacterized protein n=1 Tax=marine sediment metagenome TaxID=412755 RepID=A0A0F9PLC3_9ZZZZ